MSKVKVFIEETLCREIEIDVPDELLWSNERIEYAEKKAVAMYKNNEIVLSADDFNGQAQIMIRDAETGNETGWNNL